MSRILFQAAKEYLGKKIYYKSKIRAINENSIRVKPPTLIQKQCMNILLKILSKIKYGRITLTLPDKKTLSFGEPQFSEVFVKINDYSFFTKTLLEGEIGFGDAYVAGIWETDNLIGFLEVLHRNLQTIYHLISILSWPKHLYNKFLHKLKSNTIKQSKKNIQEHYDLSNEMFFLFLDDNKVYSSAIFKSANETLEQAQLNKLSAIIQKAELNSEDHVLEIGSGWGGFAKEAVKQTDCRVTSVTISKEQYDYVSQSIKNDKIHFKLSDYRHIEGKYDKIVSIEMLEAVGYEHLKTYFKQCEKLLNDNGLAVIQVITYPDQLYELYKNDTDWIKKNIFPGGHLPSMKELIHTISHNTCFVLESVENIGKHYAKTLQVWCDRFLANKDKILELGFNESMVRKWVYYFTCCEMIFDLRYIHVVQIVLRKVPK
jgi:cyclopropane-fatty-acyl-phospholipid synthase